MRAVELSKCICYNLRKSFVPQAAHAMALIETSFELDAALAGIFDIQQLFPLLLQFRWEAVGQTEGHELGETGLIAMRNITALSPALEGFDFLITR